MYRIKITVAVYKDNKPHHRTISLLSERFERRSSARCAIKIEIRARLDSVYFRSPRPDFDLVRYAREARFNTYVSYRITTDEECGRDSLRLANQINLERGE